jgi:hypothetical protein
MSAAVPGAGRGNASGPFARFLRPAALVVSFGLLFLVAGAAASAAKPGLGPRGWAPGELPVHLSSAAVTAVLWAAYLLGALAVLLALRRPPTRPLRWGWLVPLAVLVLLTAPFGSADHTNYAAYGRIAVQGGDPYAVPPITWHGGNDPVTSAVEPPWTMTPSIYGPLATALQAISSVIGGANLRQTVWVWQLMVVIAWVAARWLLLRLAGSPSARARVDVLWTLNPVLFGVLVLGAHVDVIATVFVLASLLLAARDAPVLAGLALGAAATTKITYGVVGVALLWAWWSLPRPAFRRRAVRLVFGALIVAVPLHVWAGPHAFRQLGSAGGSSSLATPWSLVVQLLRHVLPEWAVTTVVLSAAVVMIVATAWLLSRIVHAERGGVLGAAVVATFVLSAAYVLGAPYSLPWYDASVWALLPLVVCAPLDVVLLGRYAVMALAYVPGRVVAMSPQVESFTLGFRRWFAPWIGWLALLAILRLATAQGRSGSVPWSPRRGERTVGDGSSPSRESASGGGESASGGGAARR